MKLRNFGTGSFLLGLIFLPETLAQQAETEFVVSSAPFVSRWELEARAVPLHSTPIALTPRVWNSLILLEAVEHGAQVKKGDFLLRLDVESLEKRIAVQEKAQAIAERRLQSAELEWVYWEKITPENLGKARNEARTAREDWDYFQKLGRSNENKAAEFNLKQSEQSLKYEQEQLRQLQKMYKADDLVEETEEIILERARNSVERARFNLEQSREGTKRMLEVILPRKEETLQAAAKLATLNGENVEKNLPAALEQKRRELEKLRHDTRESEMELANLKADLRQLAHVEAPLDGTVYYGRWTQTTAGSVSEIVSRLQPGNSLMPKSILMTLVPKGGDYRFLAQLPENKRAEFLLDQSRFAKKGVAPGFAFLHSAPEAALGIQSVSLGSALNSTGGFSLLLQLEPHRQATEEVGAGMLAKVTLFEEKFTSVLVVPDRFVQSESTATGMQYFVTVKPKEAAASTEKRAVKIGRSYNGQTMIREGLLEGEVVTTNSKMIPSAKPAAPQGLNGSTGPTDGQVALRHGVEFLLQKQAKDGHWGSSRNTTGEDILAPQPGSDYAFRAATTALCAKALWECGEGKPRTEKALDLAQSWMLEHLLRARRIEPMVLYNNWAHLYGIRGLVALYQRAQSHGEEKDQQKLISAIREQVAMLVRFESVNGGWGYYDFAAETQKPDSSPTSFMTGSALLALREARDLGVEVPEKLIQRALDVIRRQRVPDGSYLYSLNHEFYPRSLINRPGGSLGRSQNGNAALRVWGDPSITNLVLCNWLDRLVVRDGWLDLGRKRPIPHESWFKVAGYFYYYGHFYAGECIQLLPPLERGQYQASLASLIIPKQEKDGSWWDFPLYDYHQSYGTAFALMTLHRCGIRLAEEDRKTL